MPTATVDGIATRYEVAGTGPPVLMLSPGGFNGTLENWRAFGIYARLGLLDRLERHYTCITFDKRESGQSGGRVERITWSDYATQALGLLDHLGIDRASVMGGCIGCSIAVSAAVAAPERVERLVLYSPAGGPRYRLVQQGRFMEHLAYVDQAGLDGVVQLATTGDATFAEDPRIGPWSSVIRRDPAFASAYGALDVETYRATVDDMATGLFDRDTVPGPEAEQLMALDVPALVVPGQDVNHAPSAARYLEECLAGSQYWDVPVVHQTEETAPARVLEFLQRSDSPRSSAAI